MSNADSALTDHQQPLVLVTGATGYVGGRLVPRLLEAGYRVRAMGRSLAKLRQRHWANHPAIELAEGDALDADRLAQAMRGVQVMYYLVHSMNPQQAEFSALDRKAATLVCRQAALAGLKRIIYLGGLGNADDCLSEHLRSRAEVAEILKSGTVPVTVLRAAMIIGSGSASFEILRYLVERLPLMVTPRWVDTPCQPIAIRNVLHYLVGCLSSEETCGQTLDIGGPETLTYRELMQTYAEEAGLGRRWIIPTPFFTPALSSYWIHLVTPLPAAIARPLAEGLRNPVVCEDTRIQQYLPQALLTPRQAMRLALDKIAQQDIETHWSDAGLASQPETALPGDPSWSGGLQFTDTRQRDIDIEASDIISVWKPIMAIGGQNGWYYGNWLWKCRGLLDKLLGGTGLRRGRRHPTELRVGDALDFWRVVRVEPSQRLLLKAEMKMPGEAYLEFELKPALSRGITVIQTARYVPKGLWGIVYWYVVMPLHHFIFPGMLKAIIETSMRQHVIKKSAPPV